MRKMCKQHKKIFLNNKSRVIKKKNNKNRYIVNSKIYNISNNKLAKLKHAMFNNNNRSKKITRLKKLLMKNSK